MVPRQPARAALLALGVLCVLGVGIGATVPPADAQSSSVVVTNVTHPTTPTVGETFEVEVTLRNYEANEESFVIEEMYATDQYGTARAVDDLGTLPPGGTTTVTLPVTLDSRGWHTFTINVNGRVGSGYIDRVRHPVTVQVVRERPPQLEVDVEEGVPGTNQSVNVTVSNGGDAPLEDVSAVVSSPDADFAVSQRVAPRLSAGNATTFRYPASVTTAGAHPVNVELRYVKDGERKHLSRTFRAEFSGPSSPGRIRLTGAEAVATGGQIELSATASNVGSTPVEGVVVSVRDTGAVRGTSYFVGRVDASDFSSFTLSTTATGNVSTVPVTVRYLVDGVERTYETELSVDRAPARPRTSPEGGSGGLPVVPLAGGAVVVLAIALVWWRR